MKRANTYRIVLSGLFTVVMGLTSTPAVGLQIEGWKDSTNPETRERFIPVELWSGAEWDGKKELKMPRVDGTYRHPRSEYRIKGPKEWKHPVTGQTFLVYERINPGEDGDKKQLFTINQDRNGLGRVYDERPGRETRTYSGGLKFPAGLWKEGKTKRFTFKLYRGSRVSQRIESIKIEKIDFTFQGNSHCLEFYWTSTNRSGRETFDRQTYIYCPGKSMVSQKRHRD